MNSKTDRNAPCPCGSGKKYKQCCLKRDEALAANRRSETVSISKTLQEAVAHHQAGRLPQAEALYQQVLQAEPDNPDALNLLGAIAQQAGKKELAAELIGKAIRSNPANPMYHYNLGLVFKELGRLDAAVESYEKTLARKPGLAEAHYSLGDVLLEQGKPEAAIKCYHSALSLRPNYPEALNNLGVALQTQGNLEEAAAYYRKALSLKPDFIGAYDNLGAVLKELQRPEEAAACYQKVLSLSPDLAEAHNSLGIIQRSLGQLNAAVASYHRALGIKPDFASAYNNLGNALKDLGQLDDAAANYRRALEIKPDYAEAHNNLGNTLRSLGQLEEAVASIRRSLELKPDYAEARNNLGLALQDSQQLAEAIANYRQALEIKPDHAAANGNLLFALNYHPDLSAEDIYKTYQEYDALNGLPLRASWRAHNNDRNPQRRLRVGYVSPDFRNHSCRSFLEPLLAHHDKTALEVYAYAELATEDDLTARYKSYVDHWIPSWGISDEALAERIRADGIDILVELAGHTAGNRLRVFSRKPAPVSLSWLGYGYTTGLSAIDYYLTDAACVPAGYEHLFAEQPWRINTPAYAYRPNTGMGEVSSLPALQHGHITFGTLTRAIRINHRTIRVWADILKAVPGSRLVIDSSNFREPEMQERMAARFVEQGINRDRLEIGFHSPPWDVLRGIDIGLDCFPHNSGTTLFETLYMGIPYVTLAGRPSLGRLGSSILHGVGHPEWIADSEGDYVAKAVALASNVARLAEIRAVLRPQMEASPLRDEAGFARKVEQAYRLMWMKWCEKDDSGISPAAKPATDKMPNAAPASLAYDNKSAADQRVRMASASTALPDAIAHHKAGHLSQAEVIYQQILEAEPDHADALHLLGVIAQQTGRNELAVELINKAIRSDPFNPMCYYNLGLSYKELDQLDAAVESYEKALARKPDFADAHNNLGIALHGSGKLSSAEASFCRALEIKPDHVKAHSNLSLALQDQGRLNEAIKSCVQALSLKPDYAVAHSNLLFALNYHPDLSAEYIFRVYQEYDGLQCAPLRASWRAHNNECNPDRRLRVGYVSPDFRNHSSRPFLEPLLAHHDKTAVEVYAYADLLKEDDMSARYKAYVDHWFPTRGMSDEALAERIRADGIDILVELAGHSANNRLPAFARKPAPVSLSWLGYGYTTGLSAIDYYLTDAACVPAGYEHLFAEEPWRIDTPAYAYRPNSGMGEVSSLPALQRGHITFGTLTRAIRINHRTIRVWADILKAVPASRLIIDSSNFREPEMQERMAARFVELGISRDRLEIGFHSPPWDVLRGIDIGLDCFPHNSGTTLFETLYMGVPCITLAGRPSVGRLGSSILQGVGHPEWIADSEDDYVARAVKLASDVPGLAEIRAALRGQMEASPLRDEAGFARKIEEAYRQMWQSWCKSHASDAR